MKVGDKVIIDTPDILNGVIARIVSKGGKNLWNILWDNDRKQALIHENNLKLYTEKVIFT